MTYIRNIIHVCMYVYLPLARCITYICIKLYIEYTYVEYLITTKGLTLHFGKHTYKHNWDRSRYVAMYVYYICGLISLIYMYVCK